MNRVRVSFGCGMALLGLAAATTYAADDLPDFLTCNVGIIRNGPGKVVKLVCPGSYSLPTPGHAPTDPGGSASLVVSTPQLDDFSPTTWKGLGNPPGSKGYKGKGDNCSVVLIKTNVVKAVCRNDGILTTPVVGPVLMELHSEAAAGAKNYCAQFGGAILKNDAIQFKAIKAPAPAACGIGS